MSTSARVASLALVLLGCPEQRRPEPQSELGKSLAECQARTPKLVVNVHVYTTEDLGVTPGKE